MAVTVAFTTLLIMIATEGQDFDFLWNTAGGYQDPTNDKHTWELGDAIRAAFTTLLIMIATEGQDFDFLWNTAGGYQDPSNDKHTWEIGNAIRAGNFRSYLVDNWDTQSFDSVSIYGMNLFGDVFWETEFNITGKLSPLASWCLGEQIVGSSADVSGTQTAIHNSYNYELRFSPATGKSWFAVSTINLSYGSLPLIFVPRSAYVPFDDPVFLDGMLGCWDLSALINVRFEYEDAVSMTPGLCIARCQGNATVAVLVKSRECHCADENTANPPIDQSSNCYLACANSPDMCGGFSADAGNAYHVPGNNLPGHVETVLIYNTTRTTMDMVIKIDVSDVLGAASNVPMYISRIIVNATGSGSTEPKYSVQYNDLNCADSGGNMKSVSFTGVTPTMFWADGTHSDVNLLRVRCIELVFDEPVTKAAVELWGPDTSSDHVQVHALVVRGKIYTEATTTSTTSTSTTTTTSSTTTSTTTSTTPSTTSSTVTTTTTPSATTTTTPPSTTSTTTPSPTSTTTPSNTSTSSTVTTTTTPSATTTTTPSSTTTTTTTTVAPPSTTTPSNTSTSSTVTTTTTHPATTTTTTLSTTSTTTSSPPSTTTSSNSTTTLSTPTTTSAPSTTTASSSTVSSTASSTTTSSIPSSSTSAGPADQTTTKPTCRCPCNMSMPQLNLTTEELQEKILNIQRRLSVNVSELSSTIRKLTSAEDSRVSAVSIGYIGVGILVSIFASIVFIDSALIFRDIKTLFHNIRTGVCPQGKEIDPQSL